MDNKRKGLIAAMVLGLISGPALAFGAAGVFGSEAEATAAEAAPVMIVTTTEASAPSTTLPTAADDLEKACAIDGPVLVAAEGSGAITDVEQAALDALREICSDAGFQLADAAIPEIEEVLVVRTVIVPATSVDGGDDDDGYDDDEYEDEDEDDDEDEDEDEDEDDDEDEDEEDDEDEEEREGGEDH